jgi:hypothetical protein
MMPKWLHKFLKLVVICFFLASVGVCAGFLGWHIESYVLKIVAFCITALAVFFGMAIVCIGIVRIIFGKYRSDE